MKIGKATFGILFLATLGVSVFAFGSSEKRTLDVGVVLRLHDKYNSTVASIDTGIEVAKKLFEKAHPNIQINLKHYSTEEDLASSVAASSQIIKDKIPAVIGGELSEEALVLGEQLGEKKIVFITPTSTSPIVTENRPYVFRSCFSDKLVAEKLALFTGQKLKPTAIGVIHNISSPYTDFLSKKYIEVFNSNLSKGQSIPIIEEKILNGNQDFTKQIDHFIEQKITHVVIFTHDSDFLKFVLQAANKNFFPVYIGSDGWGPNDKIYENLVKTSSYGDRFIGYRNSYWKEDNNTPITSLFKTSYKEQFGTEASAWSAVAFDAAWILFNAMEKTKNLKDGEKLRQEMSRSHDLTLVTTNHFKFGSDNSPKKDLYIYRIDKGGVQYEATLK
jgi:branched-chain amino acid transport system substrate-binding protein